MASLLASYVAQAVRVLLAAAAMLLVGVGLWLVVGMTSSMLGIQSPNFVLVSMILIAASAFVTGSFASVRHITPGSLIHPIVAAVGLAALYLWLSSSGKIGLLDLSILIGAGLIAGIAARVAGAGKIAVR